METHSAAGSQAVFRDPRRRLLVTSIRKGFAGGGFGGGRSLPKQIALAAQIPGTDLTPETSDLFLGFTSTQKAGLGPRLIANLETLGYADLGPGHYFAHETHMHLSHLDENLEAWYLNSTTGSAWTRRSGRAKGPVPDADGPAGPEHVATPDEIGHDSRRIRRIGHSSALNAVLYTTHRQNFLVPPRAHRSFSARGAVGPTRRTP